MKILSKARYAVSIFFAAAILLTSCGANDSYDDTTRVVTTYKNIYDIGEFATNSAGGLFFGDFDTLETVYVCSKPNCTHSDETCSAYGFNIAPTTPFVYHGDNLYWFTLEHIYNDDDLHILFVRYVFLRRKVIYFAAVFEFYSYDFHRPSNMPINSVSKQEARFALNFISLSAAEIFSCAPTRAAAE